MRPHPLQAADQHPEAGGVEEPDLLQVDDELVAVLADQVDEQLTQPRRGIDIDLALDVDDLDAVLGCSDPASDPHSPPAAIARRQRNVHPAADGPGRSQSRGVIPCHIQPRSVIIFIRNRASWYPGRLSNSPRVRELSDGCLPTRSGLYQDL